jgi:FlaA1/EpsC-like NDP-sugar epimerase
MMKKVLITGGTGTVGQSFIKEYYTEYEFHSISRNEASITALKRLFPNVNCYIGDICNLDHMVNLFTKIQPDIVIHAAALKHVNLAEENPLAASEINVLGSMNIAKASVRTNVPITIGVSTDKACEPGSTYGYTKRLMETMFMQLHNEKTKFACTRFANVAHSNGSVLPFWLAEADKGNSLKLTDINMNRLMFSKQDASRLVKKAIDSLPYLGHPFILSKKMKTVNLLTLATTISDNVEIIGKRPGEKLDEILINDQELPFTYVLDDYIYILPVKQEKSLTTKHSSATAEYMTPQEIKELIWQQ